MRTMPETLMDQARRALREERIEDAQAILINVIVREPEQDEAWLLLAEALSEPTKKRECLERARAINPRNRAILRALEHLDTTLTPTAADKPVPALTLPAGQPAPPDAPRMSGAAQEAVQKLLDYGELIAQTILLTTEVPDTRNAGQELLGTLDRAAAQDRATTRRWARSIGRAALIKYEKALTTVIANLPHDDPGLTELRDQRQRALDYLK